MPITEEEFKEICDKMYEQNKELGEKSLFYYAYLMGPVWSNSNKSEKTFEIDSPLLLGEFAEVYAYFQQTYVTDEGTKKAPKVQNHVEWLKDMLVSDQSNDPKEQKSVDDLYDDLDNDPDPGMKQLKLECEIIDNDEEDLSRINTIDIKNTFSFNRISNFAKLLWQCSYILPRYDEEKLQLRIMRFRSLAKYANLLSDKFNQTAGYWVAKTGIDISAPLKAYHSSRTRKSTDAKIKNRGIKERYVYDGYVRLLKRHNTETLKHLHQLSENKIAQMIRDEILADLKGKGISKISTKTIIDIMRNRNKEKFPASIYPWGNS